MKTMKRMAAILLTLCLFVPCFSIIVQAADGVIFFTDLETKVGDTFTITGTVVARNGILGDATVEMSYDASYIRFMEGEGVTSDTEGELTFAGSGDGSSDRLEFEMTFQALLEGSTRIEQDSAVVTNSAGETVECETGYSDITIAEGDPSKIEEVGKTVDVIIDGEEYTLSEAFTENEIPSGFSVCEITYEGEMYSGIEQIQNDFTAAYLIDEEGIGKFWFYNQEDSTFSPFEEIIISDTYSIVILNGAEEVELPEEYAEASIEINGASFSAWSDPDREDFYILYAVNSDGVKSLYRYDATEHTYQSMEMPEKVVSVAEDNSTLTKLTKVVAEYLIWVIVGVGCVFVILFVMLIVTAVKLRHRNLELDDLYDEYGIDLEEESDRPAVQAKKKGQFKKPDEQADEDYYDEDYYDEEYYDEEDGLAELRQDYMSTSAETRKYDEYYDDDDFEDDFEDEYEDEYEEDYEDDCAEEDYDYEEDYEDEYEDESKGRRSTRDDTFEMDFIDLD